jgi:hypothetical protein
MLTSTGPAGGADADSLADALSDEAGGDADGSFFFPEQAEMITLTNKTSANKLTTLFFIVLRSLFKWYSILKSIAGVPYIPITPLKPGVFIL